MVYTPQPDLVCELIVQPAMACAHLVYCGHSSSVINQGPVVRKEVSANSGLKVKLGFDFS